MLPPLRRLARIQIAFASVGLVLASSAALLRPSGRLLLEYTLAGAFLTLALYSGRALLSGKKLALRLCLLTQLLQVLHVETGRWSFLFLAGPWLEVGVSRSAVQVLAGGGAAGAIFPPKPGSDPVAGTIVDLGFRYLLHPKMPHAPLAIGVNLVALAFAASLWKARRSRPAWSGPNV